MSADDRNNHGSERSSKRSERNSVIENSAQGQEAEEVLCPSGERYRAFFNNAVVGMVEVDIATGCLLNVNDAVCRITGYSSGELLGKSFIEIIHPDDRTLNWADFQAAMQQEEPSYDAERRLVRKDGRAIWVRVHVSVVRDGQGEPAHAAAVVEDITERKEARKALRESEERFRLLVESTAQAVWETNAEGEAITASPSWRAYTGQTVDEVMGYGWVDAVHPEDRAYAERQWREAVAARRRVDAVFRLRAPGGGWRWTNVIAAPLLDEGGEVKKWVGMNIDVTERKEAEEALRESEARLEAELEAVKQLQRVSMQLIREESLGALDEQILDAAIDLMESDGGSMQEYCLESEELRLLAWRGFDEGSAAFWNRVTVESGGSCGEALRREGRVVVEDVETCDFIAGTEELEALRRCGIRAVQSTPLVSRSGRIVGMLFTYWREPHVPSEEDLRLLDVLARQAADLIDRLRAKEALREMNEILEERVERRTRQVKELASALAEAEEKERERIASILHDDVQQLIYGAELSLRSVRRRTGELPYEELRQELQEYHGQLEEALDEAQESVRMLSVELSPPLLRGESLEVALEWLAGHFEERYGLSVELDLAEGFGLAGESMRQFLFQLTRELLFNVVKHAEAPKAYVEGRRRGGRLVLYVYDEGKGFDKEEVLEERPEGRGLRALQNRLELLGGDMHIDTAPGEGTHITISIPTDAMQVE